MRPILLSGHERSLTQVRNISIWSQPCLLGVALKLTLSHVVLFCPFRRSSTTSTAISSSQQAKITMHQCGSHIMVNAVSNDNSRRKRVWSSCRAVDHHFLRDVRQAIGDRNNCWDELLILNWTVGTLEGHNGTIWSIAPDCECHVFSVWLQASYWSSHADHLNFTSKPRHWEKQPTRNLLSQAQRTIRFVYGE